MPPKPSALSASFARLSIRGLQTTAPLPPPITPLPPSSSASSTAASSSSSSSSSSAIAHLPPLLRASASPTTLPSTTSSALDLISSQSSPSAGRYILARLHSRTYLLHPKDILTVPTLKPLQAPGTALALTRILEVGSREYALRSPAADPAKAKRQALVAGTGEEAWKYSRTAKLDTIPPHLVQCSLTVLEHTKSPLQRIVKKKRRKGYKKTIQHKQGWTRLRVGDIHLGSGVGGQ